MSMRAQSAPATTGQLRVLAPTRYPWRFNGPRASRHDVQNRDFLPLNYVSAKIEGVTVLNPWPVRRFDLVHAFNRIPIGRTPFLIGLESHLPRAFGLEGGWFWRRMVSMLRNDRCRGIVAVSRFAAELFLSQHESSASADLAGKLHVRYPNLPIDPAPDPLADDLHAGRRTELRLAFVGNHFARKGGCVAVRLADLAARRGLDLHVDIVSNVEVGGAVWTDPTDPAVIAPYLALLQHPRVRHHRAQTNAQVQAILRQVHISLLPTFSDTFGYSVIESMANHTPVIATTQGALPELITDQIDGVLLPLAVTACNEWIGLGDPDRGSARYARMWLADVERLAEAAFTAVAALSADPAQLLSMRTAARASAQRFSADDANIYWDEMYDRAVHHVVGSSAPVGG